MGFKAYKWVESLDLPNTNCVAVMYALASYANEEGVCWPSQETIAQKTKLARETVNRTIKMLREGSYIKSNKRTITLLFETVITDQPVVLVNCDQQSISGDLKSQVCDKRSHKPINKQSKISKLKIDEKVFQIPDWLPPDSWNSYEEHRRKKSPLTLHAKVLAINKLDDFRSQGMSPVEVINQSILNGWTGLFPLKNQQTEGKNNDRYRRNSGYDPTMALNLALQDRSWQGTNSRVDKENANSCNGERDSCLGSKIASTLPVTSNRT